MTLKTFYFSFTLMLAFAFGTQSCSSKKRSPLAPSQLAKCKPSSSDTKSLTGGTGDSDECATDKDGESDDANKGDGDSDSVGGGQSTGSKDDDLEHCATGEVLKNGRCVAGDLQESSTTCSKGMSFDKDIGSCVKLICKDGNPPPDGLQCPCEGDTGETSLCAPDRIIVENFDFQKDLGRPSDIIFVVDRGSDTEKYREYLVSALDSFMNELKVLEKPKVFFITDLSRISSTLPSGVKPLDDPEGKVKTDEVIDNAMKLYFDLDAGILKNFVNPDAVKDIIFVSAVDSDKDQDAKDFREEILEAKSGPYYRMTKVHAIVDSVGDSCEGKKGKEYLELAEKGEFAGMVMNICTPLNEWNKSLAELGKRIASRTSPYFELKDEPKVSDIKVFVGGEALANDGWELVGDRTIKINRGAAGISGDGSVSIQYTKYASSISQTP